MIAETFSLPWTELGVALGMLAFFTGLTWLAWKQGFEREQRLATRVTQLEQSIETALMGIVRDTTKALTENAESNRSLQTAIDSWRNHSESYSTQLTACLEHFGVKCEARWKENGTELAEKLARHVEAVLERKAKG